MAMNMSNKNTGFSEDIIVDRWLRMDQAEFERLTRDEIREDLQAAFDAEVTRR